jgi:hypothetical protein
MPNVFMYDSQNQKDQFRISSQPIQSNPPNPYLSYIPVLDTKYLISRLPEARLKLLRGPTPFFTVDPNPTTHLHSRISSHVQSTQILKHGFMARSVSTKSRPSQDSNWRVPQVRSLFARNSTSIVSEVYVKINLFPPSHFIETNNRVRSFSRIILKTSTIDNIATTNVTWIAMPAFSISCRSEDWSAAIH